MTGAVSDVHIALSQVIPRLRVSFSVVLCRNQLDAIVADFNTMICKENCTSSREGHTQIVGTVLGFRTQVPGRPKLVSKCNLNTSVAAYQPVRFRPLVPASRPISHRCQLRIGSDSCTKSRRK